MDKFSLLVAKTERIFHDVLTFQFHGSNHFGWIIIRERHFQGTFELIARSVNYRGEDEWETKVVHLRVCRSLETRLRKRRGIYATSR